MTTTAKLEHINITVSDPAATAALLGRLFGWTVRWEGPSLLGGNTVHVGTGDQYLAVYTYDPDADRASTDKSLIGGLNHLGIEVEDLDATEERVKAEGLEPYNHGDYEPGRRFYFNDADDIEYEVVSYS